MTCDISFVLTGNSNFYESTRKVSDGYCSGNWNDPVHDSFFGYVSDCKSVTNDIYSAEKMLWDAKNSVEALESDATISRGRTLCSKISSI